MVRDDRITTHVALVSRALGCEEVYMTEVDPSIKQTVAEVNKRWGGGSGFKIEIVREWKNLVENWKKGGGKVVHLTMYGIDINETRISHLRQENRILVVIGAAKVPRQMYDLADYNIAIRNQPHSEVAALAIFLDRIFKGKPFEKHFKDAKLKIIPMTRGKKVVGFS